jgi:hypothetical protein
MKVRCLVLTGSASDCNLLIQVMTARYSVHAYVVLLAIEDVSILRQSDQVA